MSKHRTLANFSANLADNFLKKSEKAFHLNQPKLAIHLYNLSEKLYSVAYNY
jgi:hypothetical protein